MSINKKLVVAALAGLAIGVSSCRKYLDVNTNPNIAQTGTVTTVLPTAELYVASAMGVDMQIYGSIWSQYWTQAPDGKEYVQIEQGNPSPEAFNTSWKNLYAAAENFHQLRNIAVAQNKNTYQAISWLMEAYCFQALADGWGDVPFTEALKGQDQTQIIVDPKFDSQRVVYRGILSYIDTANVLMTQKGAITPGSDDLIYGGDMSKWKKFANTLKLRVIMRMSAADPLYAKRMMDSLYASSPEFLTEGDDARISFTAANGNNNPLYAELSSMALAGSQQLAASKTVIDTMNANNDYRAQAFFNKTSVGDLTGLNQSDYDIAMPAGSYSTPSAAVGADKSNVASATASVMLLSATESYMLQAEAVVRGLMSGDDAQLYYLGLHASFAAYSSAIKAATGLTGAEAYTIYVTGDGGSILPAYWSAYPSAGTVDARVKTIITQKWFAMCGNEGFEAWTEYRRTGYPDFLVNPRNSHLGTAFPARFLYPTTEVNANPNFPGQETMTTHVWWDKM